MKKFDYYTRELDGSDQDCIQDYFSDLGTTRLELVSVLPFQRIIKSTVNLNNQPKVEMKLLLIFKTETECQE